MQDEMLGHKATQDDVGFSTGHCPEFQLYRVLDKLPAAAYTCDQEGLITYFNQRAGELWGRPPALNNPIDRFCGSFKLFSPEGIPLAHDQCWMALALREEKAFNGYEIMIERPDGTRVHALAHANPIHDELGELLGAVNVLVDISDQKRAEAYRYRLEAELHAQKWESLRILAGGVAHDFSNLVTSMLGYVHLATTELSPESSALPMLKEIEQAACRARDLAKQMLVYAGRGKFVTETLRLDILAQEISKLMATVISKNATLRLDLAAATIKGDSTQIGQVLMNLITNASDALGDAGGVIRIRTGLFETDRQLSCSQYFPDGIAPGRYGFVEVEDSGCGMAEETLNRIFDPFFSTKLAGKGLGLAAALGIVKGHGGVIDIASTPGTGTTFKVLLPSTLGV